MEIRHAISFLPLWLFLVEIIKNYEIWKNSAWINPISERGVIKSIFWRGNVEGVEFYDYVGYYPDLEYVLLE